MYNNECDSSVGDVFEFGHTVEEANPQDTYMYALSVIVGEKIVVHV